MEAILALRQHVRNNNMMALTMTVMATTITTLDIKILTRGNIVIRDINTIKLLHNRLPEDEDHLQGEGHLQDEDNHKVEGVAATNLAMVTSLQVLDQAEVDNRAMDQVDQVLVARAAQALILQRPTLLVGDDVFRWTAQY